jgi:hypothetical protein
MLSSRSVWRCLMRVRMWAILRRFGIPVTHSSPAHCSSVQTRIAPAHPLKAIGIVATIIVFGSAMLVKEASTVL